MDQSQDKLDNYLIETLQKELNKVVKKIRSCGCQIQPVISRPSGDRAYLVEIDDQKKQTFPGPEMSEGEDAKTVLERISKKK